MAGYGEPYEHARGTPEYYREAAQRSIEARDLRKRGLLPPRDRPSRHDRQKAREIFDLQMREAILRWAYEGVPEAEIAKRLGITVRRAQKYRRESVHRAAALEKTGRLRRVVAGARRMTLYDDAAEPPRALVRSTAPASEANTDPGVSGEVLDPPDVIALREECLRLRKAALPFAMIARAVGIPEEEARRHVAYEVNRLQSSEMMNADMERRLMLEQLDQMIAAIHAPATGMTLHGERTPVVLEAIDRMLKLMKQRADLLGLAAPTAVDIRLKIQQIADEGNYDIVELEDIARDVLQAHKVRLPEYR